MSTSFSERSPLKISIHALREEGDCSSPPFRRMQPAFLSTPSARRATFWDAFIDAAIKISIHALREEGDRHDRGRNTSDQPISIHALREEGDAQVLNSSSMSPLISIHALREEGDLHGPLYHREAADFYPRPPRGGRLV